MELPICGAEIGFSQTYCQREPDHPGKCSSARRIEYSTDTNLLQWSEQQKELETLRSQIASLRALAKTMDGEAETINTQNQSRTGFQPAHIVEAISLRVRYAKAITAIVGKE